MIDNKYNLTEEAPPPMPPRPGAVSTIEERLLFIQENPGKWFKFGEYSHQSSASTLSCQIRRREPVNSWDATYRKNDEGKRVIYVRYWSKE